MIRWIFFDVGGVLLNDDAVMAAVFRHIWQNVREKGHNGRELLDAIERLIDSSARSQG